MECNRGDIHGSISTGIASNRSDPIINLTSTLILPIRSNHIPNITCTVKFTDPNPFSSNANNVPEHVRVWNVPLSRMLNNFNSYSPSGFFKQRHNGPQNHVRFSICNWVAPIIDQVPASFTFSPIQFLSQFAFNMKFLFYCCCFKNHKIFRKAQKEVLSFGVIYSMSNCSSTKQI